MIFSGDKINGDTDWNVCETRTFFLSLPSLSFLLHFIWRNMASNIMNVDWIQIGRANIIEYNFLLHSYTHSLSLTFIHSSLNNKAWVCESFLWFESLLLHSQSSPLYLFSFNHFLHVFTISISPSPSLSLSHTCCATHFDMKKFSGTSEMWCVYIWITLSNELFYSHWMSCDERELSCYVSEIVMNWRNMKMVFITNIIMCISPKSLLCV